MYGLRDVVEEASFEALADGSDDEDIVADRSVRESVCRCGWTLRRGVNLNVGQ